MEDLINQTSCQPRETLIKVHDEFPDEIQYKIVPSCVPVQRCLGCCEDEALTCTPKKKHTVKYRVCLMQHQDASLEGNCPDSLDYIESDLVLKS